MTAVGRFFGVGVCYMLSSEIEMHYLQVVFQILGDFYQQDAKPTRNYRVFIEFGVKRLILHVRFAGGAQLMRLIP